MANLAGRLAALEKRITPKPLDVVVVLNFHSEQERASAEAEYLKYAQGPVKRIFKLYDEGLEDHPGERVIEVVTICEERCTTNCADRDKPHCRFRIPGVTCPELSPDERGMSL